jgi:hypothetical protein
MGGIMRAKEIATILFLSLLEFAILVLLAWAIVTIVSNYTSIPSDFGDRLRSLILSIRSVSELSSWS